jgi:hypothetical protein
LQAKVLIFARDVEMPADGDLAFILAEYHDDLAAA